MIAVIFEVWPLEGRADDYFDIGTELRPLLDEIDGFISIERFESLAEPGKFLSLSFWQNEDAVRQWRKHEQHHAAQTKGKKEIFGDFRIRVAHVVRDYDLASRQS
ncbi:MAG: antibiotic biosynthesis monooxygenase [Fimbriimonadaceae bacterium]|nr:antibiotic biosynthesis monooxygenase [Alphaproteobacteria bacterium]